MKTKNTILALVISIFTIGSVVANEPVMASKQIASSVAEMIQDELTYPEFAIKEKFQGKVIVEVEITEDGSFDVLKGNSVFPEMIKHTAKTIENIETNDFKDYAGQKVIVSLNYDLKLY